MNLIQKVEQDEIKRLGKTVPEFSAGDTVVVNVNVVEGERKRVQAYEGLVIAKKNRGINSSFTVRKISSGEGVERTFQTYSPLIASVEVKRKGDVPSSTTSASAPARVPAFARKWRSTSRAARNSDITPSRRGAVAPLLFCAPHLHRREFPRIAPAQSSRRFEGAVRRRMA